MGICLDTEQNNDEFETSSGGERTHGVSAWAGRATPPHAAFPMQNATHVKFEPPSVPVIFVLGGPGSGKVTHCDNLMQERRTLVHINMTDLLQQYAIGNDMQDFGTLSSKTVTEVLMLEMKMAPTAKSYLVSGYPRSMRDVAEYSDKIQTISGVILISWRQRVLERQIEYGARLGHVVLSLARMELRNFYKNVMPVAEYFDQSNALVAVNGERNPEEVYRDFRAAVLQVLGADDLAPGGGIAGEIVGVEPAPAIGAISSQLHEPPSPPPAQVIETQRIVTPKPELIRVRGEATRAPCVWVVGGPGSNKLPLCQRAATLRPGWAHFSLGQRLRALADAGGAPRSDGALARAAVTAGELAPKELVTRLVRSAMEDASRGGHGLVIDGYPRTMEQVEEFQKEYALTPRLVLLDCSKLQLGRGRRDDAVGAFRRRLEVFREQTLPVLRTLDAGQRLAIVDGDTDSAEVQAEFSRVLMQEMSRAQTTGQPETAVQQFANAISRMGAGLVNGGVPNGSVPNGGVPNGGLANGFARSNEIKPMPTKIPTVSEMTQDDARLYAHGDLLSTQHI